MGSGRRQLTREKMTSNSLLAMLSPIQELEVTGLITEWIKNPEENWNLPELLLKEVEKLVSIKDCFGKSK
jgi:hypothetical protein